LVEAWEFTLLPFVALPQEMPSTEGEVEYWLALGWKGSPESPEPPRAAAYVFPDGSPLEALLKAREEWIAALEEGLRHSQAQREALQQEAAALKEHLRALEAWWLLRLARFVDRLLGRTR